MTACCCPRQDGRRLRVRLERGAVTSLRAHAVVDAREFGLGAWCCSAMSSVGYIQTVLVLSEERMERRGCSQRLGTKNGMAVRSGRQDLSKVAQGTLGFKSFQAEPPSFLGSGELRL
jgi:hypothetical protein